MTQSSYVEVTLHRRHNNGEQLARNVNIAELGQPNDTGSAIQLGKNRRTRIRQGYLKKNREGGKLKVSQPEKLMRSPRIRETKLRI